MQTLENILALGILGFIVCGGMLMLISCSGQDRNSAWRNYDAGNPKLSDPRNPPKAHFGSCSSKDLKEFTCD